MPSRSPFDDFATLEGSSPVPNAARWAAARYVCAHATGIDDARLLLTALGLDTLGESR